MTTAESLVFDVASFHNRPVEEARSAVANALDGDGAVLSGWGVPVEGPVSLDALCVALGPAVGDFERSLQR